MMNQIPQWEVDIDSGIVSSENLPYHFEFRVTDYKENGEAYQLDSSYHMDSENIYLHKNNDEIYINMRIAGRVFMNEINKNNAG